MSCRARLQGNMLTNVRPLTSLQNLRALDVARNRVASLAAISTLTALSHLSIEGNLLDSLAAVTALAALAELYAGGNRLATLRAIAPLAALPALLVVDIQACRLLPSASCLLPCLACDHVSRLAPCLSWRALEGRRLFVF